MTTFLIAIFVIIKVKLYSLKMTFLKSEYRGLFNGVNFKPIVAQFIYFVAISGIVVNYVIFNSIVLNSVLNLTVNDMSVLAAK